MSATFDKHWWRWLLLLWLAVCAWLLWQRWGAIGWNALPDTDDNLRMAQVRAWLNGHGWYDLRQYKLNPPDGFNVHWSRLVDLPIAALQLLLRPFLGVALADKWSGGLAPLLPLLAAMAALALTARRLIHPYAWIVAALLLVTGAQVALNMFRPLRVDHHGWQLAMLAWTLAGLADPKARRGGATMGLSSALSLIIGLELLPFLAVCGAAVALHWVFEPEAETPRLRSYALTLAAGCALGFLLFATYDNRVWRCDVLSPVWLSVMVAAGSFAFLITFLPLRAWPLRLAAAAAIGALLAAGFALAFPQCLGRPEQISDELYDLWFRNVREAKPLYAQGWGVIFGVAALPLAGLIGSVYAAMQARGTRAFGVWAPIALVSTLSLLLCFWQTRNGTAAQVIAIPGAVAFIWAFAPPLLSSPNVLDRTLGVVAVVLLGSGLLGTLASGLFPADKPTPALRAVNRANASCPTLPALRPLDRLPTATIFTFVDLGPRLINVTRHRAVAGPYHRNGQAILDVHHAFGGSPDEARAIMQRHGATLLLICPNMNEATVYRARTPRGFYSRLAKGERFDWLSPVALPAKSPFKLWRIAPAPAPATLPPAPGRPTPAG